MSNDKIERDRAILAKVINGEGDPASEYVAVLREKASKCSHFGRTVTVTQEFLLNCALSLERTEAGSRRAEEEIELLKDEIAQKAELAIIARRNLAAERSRREGLERVKDAVYKERDRLVSFLSHLFPSSLERHPDLDKAWDDDWRWIVYVDSPVGQLSWHIHDSELPLFDHLSRCTGKRWDGHSTEEKYDRLARLPGCINGEM